MRRVLDFGAGHRSGLRLLEPISSPIGLGLQPRVETPRAQPAQGAQHGVLFPAGDLDQFIRRRSGVRRQPIDDQAQLSARSRFLVRRISRTDAGASHVVDLRRTSLMPRRALSSFLPFSGPPRRAARNARPTTARSPGGRAGAGRDGTRPATTASTALFEAQVQSHLTQCSQIGSLSCGVPNILYSHVEKHPEAEHSSVRILLAQPATRPDERRITRRVAYYRRISAGCGDAPN